MVWLILRLLEIYPMVLIGLFHQFMHHRVMVTIIHSLKTNWLKQPVWLFVMWTTIILVKLIEFWLRFNNDWFEFNIESIGSTMLIG